MYQRLTSTARGARAQQRHVVAALDAAFERGLVELSVPKIGVDADQMPTTA
jgi:hypothetical protein